jgi:hypothetical protein
LQNLPYPIIPSAGIRKEQNMGLRLNTHGLLGIILIALMFGIAYLLHWNINWVYFAVAIVLYTVLVIPLTIGLGDVEGETSGRSAWLVRLLFSCHFALIFLAIGLWSHFSDNRLNSLFFVTGASAGFSIPFSLVNVNFWTRRHSGTVSVKFSFGGVLGVIAIILMFGIAFYYRWDINLAYFVAAIILYALVVIIITLKSEDYYAKEHSNSFKLLLGCHLALFILAIGLYFHFQGYTNLFFFIGGTTAGLAIPFLLIRG